MGSGLDLVVSLLLGCSLVLVDRNPDPDPDPDQKKLMG